MKFLLNWLRKFVNPTISIDMHRGVIRFFPGQGRGVR
jgi:hypothetical protein